MTDAILKQYIAEYERNLRAYAIAKQEADKAESYRGEVAQEGIRISKQILKHIGFDVDNFHGGVYNFTDEILPYLKRVSEADTRGKESS